MPGMPEDDDGEYTVNAKLLRIARLAGRLGALAELLDQQGVEYGWAGERQTASGTRYAGGLATPEAGRVTVEPGGDLLNHDLLDSSGDGGIHFRAARTGVRFFCEQETHDVLRAR